MTLDLALSAFFKWAHFTKKSRLIYKADLTSSLFISQASQNPFFQLLGILFAYHLVSVLIRSQSMTKLDIELADLP